MAGVLLYLFRDVVKYSAPLAWLSVCALFVCLWFPSMKYLCPAPAAYLTVYLGLLNPPRLKSILSGDYSYGLYLYGFPIQQAVASFGPKMHHWYVNLAISFPLAAACAVGSWWLVEKNCLSLRRYLKA
jgi:peptidoglycan/LPS O-acetylase OafA/YrhL